MRTFKYRYSPPDPNNPSFDRLCENLLKIMFPLLPVIWFARPPWAEKLISKSKYQFCQFATGVLVFLYRSFLRKSAALSMSEDDAQHAGGIRQLSKSPLAYTMRYNCPPASCRWWLKGPKPEKGIQRCARRFCPHCHFRRAVKIVNRVVRSAVRARLFCRNLATFVYQLDFDDSTHPSDVAKTLTHVTKSAVRSRNYLGGFSYFRPIIRADHSLVWRARVFIIGSNDFELDNDGIPAFVALKKSKPATNIGIIRQVALALSWGKKATWFNHELGVMWNAMIHGSRSFVFHGDLKNNNEKAFQRFRHFKLPRSPKPRKPRSPNRPSLVKKVRIFPPNWRTAGTSSH